jgi:hyperosmotically inducible protein
MNRTTGRRSLALVGSLLLGYGMLAFCQDQAPQNSPSSDNTKVNQQSQKAGEPTADQQQNNVSDRDVTKQIRQSILGDKMLSAYAHNVKVITQDGEVTLRGPVRSVDEKRVIEEKAAEIAGEVNVISELTVKPETR